MRPRKKPKDENDRREEALRPCGVLGYDRETLALHLLECGAFQIAEKQMRRAVWLNPFEPRFKIHLAWCLYRQGRYADALACLGKVPPDRIDEHTRQIVRLIERGGTVIRIDRPGYGPANDEEERSFFYLDAALPDLPRVINDKTPAALAFAVLHEYNTARKLAVQ